MDVASYISELLGQYGEINVPGLGYFVKLRVDGYYNADEATFYPPAHKIEFDPQCIDDDVLMQHIAIKKHISLASSRYFTEKYINNLKEEALLKDVAVADLGWINTDGSKITFKPVDVFANDPVFYGYPQIKVKKLADLPETVELEVAEPESVQPEPVPEPVRERYIPDYLRTEFPIPPLEVEETKNEDNNQFIFTGEEYAEDQSDKRSRTWIIVLLILIIIGLAVLGLYKYKPGVFDNLLVKPASVAFPAVPLKKPAKPDSSKTTTAQTAIDTAALTHFELQVGTFKTIKKANIEIERYKNMGLDAHLITGPGTGPLKKISLGTYFKKEQADSAAKSLRKKVKKIEIDQIN